MLYAMPIEGTGSYVLCLLKEPNAVCYAHLRNRKLRAMPIIAWKAACYECFDTQNCSIDSKFNTHNPSAKCSGASG
eukprot:SAG22_NODE_1803_length_3533_cov_25.281013_5_plen_76_part_00